MKKTIAAWIALAVMAIFISSAEATIRIKVAEVQNGAAFIRGSAEKSSPITWETQLVTTTNTGGQFSFHGVVPADCVGTLSDGVSTIDVLVLDCTPASVSTAPAPVPTTGQTTCWDSAGVLISCAGTGHDGDLQKGVTWPVPRFTQNGNGTITDNLTGLVWLKNANCPNTGRDWAPALADVASLNTNGTMNGNDCGDTSNGGTHQTDWRLPNIRELYSLVDSAFINPAISNTAGTGQGSVSDPFSNLSTITRVWASTSFAGTPNTNTAWFVDLGNGITDSIGKAQSNHYLVFAVRGGS